jgi:hypothetical protein
MLLVTLLIDFVSRHRLDPRLDRCVVARFERHRHGGSDRVEVDIGGARQQRRFVGQACRTVPILKKPSAFLFLVICPLCDTLTEQSHPPTEIG